MTPHMDVPSTTLSRRHVSDAIVGCSCGQMEQASCLHRTSLLYVCQIVNWSILMLSMIDRIRYVPYAIQHARAVLFRVVKHAHSLHLIMLERGNISTMKGSKVRQTLCMTSVSVSNLNFDMILACGALALDNQDNKVCQGCQLEGVTNNQLTMDYSLGFLKTISHKHWKCTEREEKVPKQCAPTYQENLINIKQCQCTDKATGIQCAVCHVQHYVITDQQGFKICEHCDKGITNHKGNCDKCTTMAQMQSKTTNGQLEQLKTSCTACPIYSGLVADNETDDAGAVINRNVCIECNNNQKSFRKHCTSCDRTKCLSCIPSLILHNNDCVSSCPDGYYAKVDTSGVMHRRTCVQCDVNCKSCVGPGPTKCKSCASAAKYLEITDAKAYWGQCKDKTGSGIQNYNYIVNYATGSDTTGNGLFTNPFKTFTYALQVATDYASENLNSSVGIYIAKGEHFLQAKYDEYYPIKFDDRSLALDILIQPLHCSLTISDYQSNALQQRPDKATICVPDGEKVQIYNKRGLNLHFNIPRSLTMKFLVIDSIMSGSDFISNCPNDDTKCCEYTNGAFSGGCATSSYFGSYSNCSNTQGGNMFDFMYSDAMQEQQVLTLQDMEFSNIFFEMNALIGLSNNNGQVEVKNSQFYRFSHCGSVFRNNYGYIPPDYFITNQDNIATTKIYQEIMQNTHAYTLMKAKQPPVTTTPAKIHLNIVGSTFNGFGILKATQDNLYIDPDIGAMRHQAMIAYIEDYIGKISINSNNIQDNIFNFQITTDPTSTQQSYQVKHSQPTTHKCSFIDMIYNDLKNFKKTTWAITNIATYHGNARVLQNKNLIYIKTKGLDNVVEIKSNTFKNNLVMNGMVHIEHDSSPTQKALIIINSNDFIQNAALIGSNGIKIDSLTTDRYISSGQLPYTTGVPCTGISISENTFQYNAACRRSRSNVIDMNCLSVFAQGLRNQNFFYNYTAYYEDVTTQPATNIYSVGQNYNYSDITNHGAEDSQTINGVTIDKSKTMLIGNTFDTNYISAGVGLINFRHFRKVYIKGDTYTKNQGVYAEVFDHYTPLTKVSSDMSMCKNTKNNGFNVKIDPIPFRCIVESYDAGNQRSDYFKSPYMYVDIYFPKGLIYVFSSSYLHLEDVVFDNNFLPSNLAASNDMAQLIYTWVFRGNIVMKSVKFLNMRGMPEDIKNKLSNSDKLSIIKPSDASQYNGDTLSITNPEASKSYIPYGMSSALVLHKTQHYPYDTVTYELTSCTFTNLTWWYGFEKKNNYGLFSNTLNYQTSQKGVRYLYLKDTQLSDVYCQMCQQGFFSWQMIPTVTVDGGTFQSFGKHITDVKTQVDNFPAYGIFQIHDTNTLGARTTDFTNFVCTNNVATTGPCITVLYSNSDVTALTLNVNIRNVTMNFNNVRVFGALYVQSSIAKILIDNTTFEKNQATLANADIYSKSFTSFTITNCIFLQPRLPTDMTFHTKEAETESMSSKFTFNSKPWPVLKISNTQFIGDGYGGNATANYYDGNFSGINPHTTKEKYYKQVRTNAMDNLKLGSPIYVFQINLEMSLNQFSYNSYSAKGGAMKLSYVNLVDYGSIFLNNAAVYGGGMFYEKCKSISMTSTNFFSNKAIYGGGMSLLSDCVLGTGMKLNFLNNVGFWQGGGIYALAESSGTISHSTFTSNKARESNCLKILACKTFTIEHSVLKNNHATLKGTAVGASYSEQLTVTNTTFEDNVAISSTPGIFLSYSYLTMTDSKFVNSLDEQSEMQKNKISGGFISISVSSHADIKNTQFIRGIASSGGVLFMAGLSSVQMINVTVSDTRAKVGGAIYLQNFDYVELKNYTSTKTYSDEEGSEVYAKEGTLTIINCSITKDNTPSFPRNYISLYKVEYYGLGNVLTGTLPQSTTKQQANLRKRSTHYGGGFHVENPIQFVLINSIIQNISIAGRGGGIYITEATFNTSSKVSQISNVTIQHCRSLEGGAIALYQVSKMEIKSCTFKNNYAYKVKHPYKPIDIGGKGGAVFYESFQQIIANKMVIIANGVSQDNKAAEEAGAVYFNYEEPGNMTSHKMTNNIAGKYGDQRASFTQNLKSVSKEEYDKMLAKSDISTWDQRLLTGTNQKFIGLTRSRDLNTVTGTTSLSLANQQSGGSLPTIYVALVDSQGQIVGADSSSTITISIINTAGTITPILKGTTTLTVTNGVVKFENITFTAQPGQSYQLKFTTNGVDSTKPTNMGVSIDVNFTIGLRNCIEGEAYMQTGACKACTSTQYSLVKLNQAGDCKNCDTSKMICLGGSKIGPKAGYWRSSNTTDNFIQCLNMAACLGMIPPKNVPTGECFKGYQGIICADCEVGYSQTGDFQCGLCPDPVWNVIRISLIMVAVVVGIAFMVRSSLQSALKLKNIQSVYIKILMNHMQLVLITASFDFHWPDNVDKVLNASKPVAAVSQQILSFDCFLDTRKSTDSPDDNSMPVKIFYQKMIMYALMPLLMAAVSFIFWSVWFLIRRDKKMKGKKIGRVMASLIILLFLVHPNIVSYMFSSFNCKQIDNDERVESQLTVVCWKGEHVRWTLIASLPSLVIWGLGIPLFSAMVLTRNKHNLHKISTREKYGFLYNGYRKNFYYWESIIMYRKIMLIFISVFLKIAGVITQAMVTFLMLVVFLALNMKYRPFTFQTLNDMETISIITSITTIYCGIFFISSSNMPNDFLTNAYFQLILFFIIVISNGIFLTYFAFKMSTEVMNTLRANFGKVYMVVCLCNQKDKYERELEQRRINDENEILLEEFERQVESIRKLPINGSIKLDKILLEKSGAYLHPDAFLAEVKPVDHEGIQEEEKRKLRIKRMQESQKLMGNNTSEGIVLENSDQGHSVINETRLSEYKMNLNLESIVDDEDDHRSLKKLPMINDDSISVSGIDRTQNFDMTKSQEGQLQTISDQSSDHLSRQISKSVNELIQEVELDEGEVPSPETFRVQHDQPTDGGLHSGLQINHEEHQVMKRRQNEMNKKRKRKKQKGDTKQKQESYIQNKLTQGESIRKRPRRTIMLEDGEIISPQKQSDKVLLALNDMDGLLDLSEPSPEDDGSAVREMTMDNLKDDSREMKDFYPDENEQDMVEREEDYKDAEIIFGEEGCDIEKIDF